MQDKVSKNAIAVLHVLQTAGYEAYLVGGCVRDLLLNKTPKDWDITTNATPEDIIPLFPKAVYENSFGTVAIIFEEETEQSLRSIEVTTYRSESNYTDNRHPDNVSFSKNIEDDLKRRDFTINAMAYDPMSDTLIDLYKGQEDLEDKSLRTVGNSDERFQEDALRLLRAVRFCVQLGFHMEQNTEKALKNNANLIEHVSRERIRDEFNKVILSPEPKNGLELMRTSGVLAKTIPELLDGYGVDQNRSHIFDVYTHLINSLQHAADKDYPLHVRLSALFHDIGKPATKRFDKKAKEFTFYGHEVIGARIVKDIMKRLHYPKKTSEDVYVLVRYHMFFSDPDLITLSAVRRIITNVTPERIWDLIHLRYCDRIGMGRPKEDPYRLRKYESMIEEALRDPISVKMLKLDGDMMISELHMKPGPRMGWILHALLEEVLDDPTLNTKKFLVKRALELDTLLDTDLRKLGKSGLDTQKKAEEAEIKDLRQKYHVK